MIENTCFFFLQPKPFQLQITSSPLEIVFPAAEVSGVAYQPASHPRHSL